MPGWSGVGRLPPVQVEQGQRRAADRVGPVRHAAIPSAASCQACVLLPAVASTDGDVGQPRGARARRPRRPARTSTASSKRSAQASAPAVPEQQRGTAVVAVREQVAGDLQERHAARRARRWPRAWSAASSANAIPADAPGSDGRAVELDRHLRGADPDAVRAGGGQRARQVAVQAQAARRVQLAQHGVADQRVREVVAVRRDVGHDELGAAAPRRVRRDRRCRTARPPPGPARTGTAPPRPRRRRAAGSSSRPACGGAGRSPGGHPRAPPPAAGRPRRARPPGTAAHRPRAGAGRSRARRTGCRRSRAATRVHQLGGRRRPRRARPPAGGSRRGRARRAAAPRTRPRCAARRARPRAGARRSPRRPGRRRPPAAAAAACCARRAAASRSVPSSAQCRSSTISTTGRPRTRPARKPDHRRRAGASVARRAAATVPPERGRRAPGRRGPPGQAPPSRWSATASANGWNGSRPAPSRQRPDSTAAPRAVTRPASSASSRVLPMPGSPDRNVTRPRPAATSARWSSSVASWVSRPKHDVAGRATGRGGVTGRPQRRVLGEDRRLQLPRLRAGLDAELVGEHRGAAAGRPRAPRPAGRRGRAPASAGSSAARAADRRRRASRTPRRRPGAGPRPASRRSAPPPSRRAARRAGRLGAGELRSANSAKAGPRQSASASSNVSAAAAWSPPRRPPAGLGDQARAAGRRRCPCPSRA